MSFIYPKSRNFNAPSRMGTSGRTAAAYSLGKMGSGFGSISRIYNFCHNNTGDYSSAIQCVFGVQSTPGPGPTPPTPVLTTFFYSTGDPVTTTESTITQFLYLVNEHIASELVSVTFGSDCLSLGTLSDEYGSGCFQGCTNLTSIVIPNSVTTIGANCFAGCSGLTSMTIPDNVTTIGAGGFSYCSNLTYVRLPTNLTSLYNNCFRGCLNLPSITIPTTVTSIGFRCFQGCAFTSIVIPNNVTSIGYYGFAGCAELTSVTLPTNANFNTLTDNCFGYCSKLTSITIPSSVTTIEPACLANCPRLTSIPIPNLVTTIGLRSFWNDVSLNSITITSSVTTIGDRCCLNCTSLTSVTFIYPGHITEDITNMLLIDNEGVPSPVVIKFYNIGGTNWSALNSSAPRVSAYFTETPPKSPQDTNYMTYEFYASAPP